MKNLFVSKFLPILLLAEFLLFGEFLDQILKLFHFRKLNRPADRRQKTHLENRQENSKKNNLKNNLKTI